MNAYLTAAGIIMVVGLLPALFVAARGDELARLIGLELASALTTIVLLLLAQGYHRSSYADLALVLAVLSTAGTLVFVRLFGRRA